MTEEAGDCVFTVRLAGAVYSVHCRVSLPRGSVEMFFPASEEDREETSSAVLSAYVVPWLLQRVTVVTRYTPSSRCRRA